MTASHEQHAATEAEALRELAEFPLVEAIYGRRSRRFALGDEIPDGPLAYRSRHEPLPLTELERMLVLSAMGGTTGWHYSITRHARYAPARLELRRRGRPGARSRPRPAFTPPSCSSPTTRACTSSRPATPARSSTRPSRRSRPS